MNLNLKCFDCAFSRLMAIAWDPQLTFNNGFTYYSIIVAIFAGLQLMAFMYWLWARKQTSSELQLFKFIGLAIGIRALDYLVYLVLVIIEEGDFGRLIMAAAVLSSFLSTLGTALTFIAIAHMCVSCF